MSYATLGIIGSGQLGSLLCQAAKKLNIKTVVVSDDKMDLLKNTQMILYILSTITKKKLRNL